MTRIIEFGLNIISSLWAYSCSLAPYFLFGLVFAGLVKTFISESTLQKHFGEDGLIQVIKASLIGIPLPMCSCSVIPTSVTLKKSGANNATVSAFLISTPESGIDSISVTYGMMDPVMAVVRPVAAFFSALLAGIFQLIWNPGSNKTPIEKKTCCNKMKESVNASFANRAKSAFRYSFIDLFDDLSSWLAIGIIAGSLIEVFLPPDIFTIFNSNLGKIGLILIGIPLYVCASASTPVAVSLMAKGMSPGGALIFLLTGPATNISNLIILQRYIGKKGVAINVAVISAVALVFSYLTDVIYDQFQLKLPIDPHLIQEHSHHSWVTIFLTIVFLGMLTWSLIKKWRTK